LYVIPAKAGIQSPPGNQGEEKSFFAEFHIDPYFFMSSFISGTIKNRNETAYKSFLMFLKM